MLNIPGYSTRKNNLVYQIIKEIQNEFLKKTYSITAKAFYYNYFLTFYQGTNPVSCYNF